MTGRVAARNGEMSRQYDRGLSCVCLLNLIKQRLKEYGLPLFSRRVVIQRRKVLRINVRHCGDITDRVIRSVGYFDDMLLKRELQLSLEEIERGEYEDVFEATADIKRKLAEGR